MPAAAEKGLYKNGDSYRPGTIGRRPSTGRRRYHYSNFSNHRSQQVTASLRAVTRNAIPVIRRYTGRQLQKVYHFKGFKAQLFCKITMHQKPAGRNTIRKKTREEQYKITENRQLNIKDTKISLNFQVQQFRAPQY